MIRLAVLGGGINSAVGKAHLTALIMTRKFKIVAANFSKDTNINIQSAEQYGLNNINIYSDYKSLIEREKENFDYLLILTPTDQHLTHVLEALNNGVNVICEKALAMSCSELDLIKTTLKRTNCRLFVIFNYIGYPMIKELKQIILSNKIGNIFSIHIEMPQEGYLKTQQGQLIMPQNWRCKDSEISTISLDLGVHLHSLIYYITNKVPLNVCAMKKNNGNIKGITDDINAIIDYSGNLTCNMWYSKSALGHSNGLKVRIYGEKGSIFWEQSAPDILNLSDTEGFRYTIDRANTSLKIANHSKYNIFKAGHPSGFVEALSNYYNDLSEAIKFNIEDSTEVFGVDVSYNGLELFSAIERSSSEKTWIKVGNA